MTKEPISTCSYISTVESAGRSRLVIRDENDSTAACVWVRVVLRRCECPPVSER